jgi:outer membrane lipoprotein-sorting protein
MNVKNSALRLAGAAMIAVALAPWVGGAAANAAVIVNLDDKWIGTNSATSTVTQAGCAYDEVQMTHDGQGWHFVLPGGSGLTTFTASFQSAGLVTVTTTETTTGVIVQDGKGAVVYTPTDDTLVAWAAFNGHAGQGTAESGPNPMQLSHLCNGEATPTESPTPTPSQTTSTAVVTTPTPVVTTATPAASVLPTKATASPTKATASPKVSVKGTKTVLPHTGSGLPVGLLLVASFGLLLGGGALMMLPGLAPVRGKRRKH